MKINKSKTLIQHKWYKCKCKFDGRKCNVIKSRITINANVGGKVQRNIMYGTKIIFGILVNELVKTVNIKEVLLAIQ